MRCVADEADAGADTGEMLDARAGDDTGAFDAGPTDTGRVDTGMTGNDTGIPVDAFMRPDTAIDAYTPFDAWAPDACSPSTFYADTDGDGYGNASASMSGCVMPSGYVANNTDCNDGNTAVHPGATEVCNEIDDNCAGGVDEGVLMTLYVDADLDGFGGTTTALACAPRAGLVATNTDCNDSNAAIRPDATETCNMVDDNCAGGIDEGVQTTFYVDSDGDTYGTSVTMLACALPPGYATRSGDCNDMSASVYPGRMETCNGVDDNCAGGIDDGNPGGGMACASAAPGICRDGTTICRAGATACDPNIAPGSRAEVCNLLDDDCNGVVDNGVQTTFYRDADSDTYGNASVTMAACAAPSGYVSNSSDCNDSNPAIRPGATETCDGVDNDCTGGIDGAAATTWCGLPAQLMALNAASAACTAGSCVQTSCAGTYRDCSAPTSNCETNTATSATNCGACGNVCNWGSCIGGVCDEPIRIEAGGGGATATTSAGGHSCAVRQSGTVVCWGRNDFGQLGNGTTTNSNRPVVVTGLTSIVEIALGLDHTCARSSTNAVYCWGRNQLGQVGVGSATTYFATPQTVVVPPEAGGIAELRAGDAHTCARNITNVGTGAGSIYCWGSDAYGQLGNGAAGSSTSPVLVDRGNATSLQAGAFHNCAFFNAFPGFPATAGWGCWGANWSSQLGNGMYANLPSPTVMPALASATSMALGDSHTCFIQSGTGAVRCVGSNGEGQLGNGTFGADQTTPVTAIMSGATEVSAGWRHTCARIGDVVQCWGMNTFGQIGDTTTSRKTSPVTVINMGATRVSVGSDVTCALLSGNVARCWGRGTYGQVGDGTNMQRNIPTTVVAP